MNDEKTYYDDQPKPERKSHITLWVIVVVLIIGVLVGVGFWLIDSGKIDLDKKSTKSSVEKTTNAKLSAYDSPDNIREGAYIKVEEPATYSKGLNRLVNVDLQYLLTNELPLLKANHIDRLEIKFIVDRDGEVKYLESNVSDGAFNHRLLVGIRDLPYAFYPGRIGGMKVDSWFNIGLNMKFNYNNKPQPEQPVRPANNVEIDDDSIYTFFNPFE